MKITFLTVMPSPYVQDLFESMNNDPRFDLRVLYMEQEAPDTHWGKQKMPDYAKVLPGRWLGFSGARIHINPAVRRELLENPADLVVIVGYVGITNQIAMRSLTRRNQPWVFWGEVPGFQSRGLVGSQLRSLAQRPLKLASGIAAVGSHAVDAYRNILSKWNCAEIPIHNIPYHCNLTEYRKAAIARERLNSDVVRFLYCGQLIKRKGVDLLIEAFSRLVEEGKKITLTLAGDGPLREMLQTSLSPAVTSQVSFLGFRPVVDLPQIFSEADVFILPSRHDGWGVVVNQAVAAGMPIIATDKVGAANDLVIPNENGFRIEADSATAIYKAMNHFVQHPDTITTFAERSKEVAKLVSLEQALNDWFYFFSEALDWNREDCIIS